MGLGFNYEKYYHNKQEKAREKRRLGLFLKSGEFLFIF